MRRGGIKIVVPHPETGEPVRVHLARFKRNDGLGEVPGPLEERLQ